MYGNILQREQMRKATRSQLLDIAEILEENYYTLSVSGADAIVNIYDEIEAGHFDAQVLEWGITMGELYEAVAELRRKLTREGKIQVVQYAP